MVEGSSASQRLGPAPRRWLRPRLLIVAGLAVAALGLLGSVATQELTDSPSGASVTTVPTVVSLAGSSNVLVTGSGLEPGTVISVLVKDSFGLFSNVTGLMSPNVITVNDDGAFAATWALGRWTRVSQEGLLSLRIVDEDYQVLATAPLLFCNPTESESAFCGEDFLGK